MKFLLDQNVSPALVGLLADADHLAEHVRDLGKREAPDDVVLAAAGDADAVLISSDTDFGELLRSLQRKRAVRDFVAASRRPSCERDRFLDRRQPPSRCR
ncbi:MAG TPA: DUF5615 family PIN-like protein [Ilumatobacteraceae bacterium]|nr:DUF5615 family PIN-like protein [Ilumatobacteraceae bacterium]